MSTAAPPAFRDRQRDPITTIGVDIGSTNTKVALLGLFEGSPRELGIRSFRTPDAPAELGRAVLAAIHGLTSTRPRSPVAVGIASMAESGVVLDDDARPVGPLVRWTAGASAPLFDAIDANALRDLAEATGVPATPKVPLATWHRLQLE
ncbi:hypothetical protein [Mycetocola sp. 2940]|uniref:hypothetical protein n=1 Tax=Mycetocola sp. 2940 TaxID=3156452 RepID=UPI003394A1FB